MPLKLCVIAFLYVYYDIQNIQKNIQISLYIEILFYKPKSKYVSSKNKTYIWTSKRFFFK